MQSDFGVMCKGARQRISVPAIPLAAIRKAAECRPAPRSRKRWAGFIAVVWASATIVAAAAGAAVWSSTHVSLDRSGTIELTTERLAFTKNPTIENLRLAARQADFPVVLPAGLPEGTTLVTMTRAGSSALLFQYNLPGAWRRSNHVLTLLLANPKTLAHSTKSTRGAYTLSLGGNAEHGSVHWIIGHEEVIMTRSTLTPVELVHIKNAMIAHSRRQ